MRDDELRQPVNRREFLESTGRFAAALGWAGAMLAPGCGPGEEPPAPAQRPVVDTHMHVWANDPARYPFPHPYISVWVKVSELTSVSGAKYPFREALSWVRRVYEEFGADKLLWGTGHPGAARAAYERPSLAEELALVREEMTFFNSDDLEKILGLNAARIWNLSS